MILLSDFRYYILSFRIGFQISTFRKNKFPSLLLIYLACSFFWLVGRNPHLYTTCIYLWCLIKFLCFNEKNKNKNMCCKRINKINLFIKRVGFEFNFSIRLTNWVGFGLRYIWTYQPTTHNPSIQTRLSPYIKRWYFKLNLSTLKYLTKMNVFFIHIYVMGFLERLFEFIVRWLRYNNSKELSHKLRINDSRGS